MKTLYESVLDIDDNIEAIEKVKDNPRVMFNRNCKDFEEVVDVFAKWFGCKTPKIIKSSKVLKQWDNKNGIRLHNDKIAEFNLSYKDNNGSLIYGKVITLALWEDTLLIQYRRWDMVRNWSSGRATKKWDKDIYLVGNYNENYKYKWGTNLWDWIKMLIDGYDLPKYVINKTNFICESIFDIDDNIKDDSVIRLLSKWEPITFRSNYGPKEVFDIIKTLKLDPIEVNGIRWIDYTVERPWGKKSVHDGVENIIKHILSCYTWEEAQNVLTNKSVTVECNNYKALDRMEIKIIFKNYNLRIIFGKR